MSRQQHMGTTGKMNIAFVIGNGLSRKNFELNQLHEYGKVYVCNQAIVDIAAQNVVAVDKSMVIKLISSGVARNAKVWTRHIWAKNLLGDQEIHSLVEKPYPAEVKWDREIDWGSGTHAVWLAASKHPVVVMIGFDLVGSGVYNQKQIDPRHWIHQLKQTFTRHPDCSFVQVQPTDWKTPSEWKTVTNLSRDTFHNVLKTLGV